MFYPSFSSLFIGEATSFLFSIQLEPSVDSNLYQCQAVLKPGGSSSPDELLYYIELTMRVETAGSEKICQPLVRCDSEALAKWVSTPLW